MWRSVSDVCCVVMGFLEIAAYKIPKPPPRSSGWIGGWTPLDMGLVMTALRLSDVLMH